MKKIVLLFTFFLYCAIFHAQNFNARSALQHRLTRIDLYHVSIGIEGATNVNAMYGVRTSVGIGSRRHLMNADLGLGLRGWNYLFHSKDNYLRMFQMPFFISTNINPIRWANGCVYLGGEASMQFALHNSTATLLPNHAGHDISAINNYASVRGKVGVMLGQMKIAVFYERDLDPLCNQKYMYESGLYDFESMRSSLYEHSRLGLSLTYQFNL